MIKTSDVVTRLKRLGVGSAVDAAFAFILAEHVYVIDPTGIAAIPFVITSWVPGPSNVMIEEASGTLSPPAVGVAVHSPSRNHSSDAHTGNVDVMLMCPPGGTTLSWPILKATHVGSAPNAAVDGVAENVRVPATEPTPARSSTIATSFFIRLATYGRGP